MNLLNRKPYSRHPLSSLRFNAIMDFDKSHGSLRRDGRFDSVSKSFPIQLLEDHSFQSIINQNSQFEFTLNVAFGLNRSLTDKLSCQEYDWSPSGSIGEHAACCRCHQKLASQLRWQAPHCSREQMEPLFPASRDDKMWELNITDNKNVWS